MKEADVTAIDKKGKKGKKENYRPVSILPVLSKLFERMLFIQMSAFFEDIFNKQQCGFRKGYKNPAMSAKNAGSADEGRLIFSLDKCGYCQFR